MNLVCIGHAKCGTTLLDSVFRGSRLVSAPVGDKELKFFMPAGFERRNARQRYLEKFGTGDQAPAGTFEASPQYSQQGPEVLEEILRLVDEVLPDSRIIICFRHPVLRAYSHYIHDLHKFALYGDLVFSPRPALLGKPFKSTFAESLPRLARSYSNTLKRAIEAVGRERIALFFLERDAECLGEWVARELGDAVARDVSNACADIGRVFVRRPVPNYVFDGRYLHAFGSNEGEYVRYQPGNEKEAGTILEARERWTLRLDPEEAGSLNDEYFRSDLEKCVQLTGDNAFLEYLDSPFRAESAKLSSVELLGTLHGVVLDGAGSLSETGYMGALTAWKRDEDLSRRDDDAD